MRFWTGWRLIAPGLLGLWLGASCNSQHGGGGGGCGGAVGPEGDVVGGPCRDHVDCSDRCVRGGSYPDGTCTVNCEDDRDCPDGTWCVDRNGGVCLLDCRSSGDCRPGYRCRDTDREGAGGERPVCRD